jgi:predicted nuclease of predicted toxin-antitoxin system
LRRFKTDENLPVEVAGLLRQHQHDALTAIDQLLGGQPDPNVAVVCQAERRALVTLDLDFADIRQYPPEDYPGIIVLRPAFQTITSLLRLTARIISLLGQESLEGHLWTVDDHRVRIRGSSVSGEP